MKEPASHRDDEYPSCFLCGRNGNGDRLEAHHVFGASNRKKSEQYGAVVWLCKWRCHNGGVQSVHMNGERNGKVVESIGRDSGTVETDFARRQSGALYWTHFGYWPSVGAAENGSADELEQALDTADGDTVTSIMGSVRVRDYPKTGKTIYILRKGKSLTIEEYDADTGWYCVTTPNGSGFITNNPKYVSVEVG